MGYSSIDNRATQAFANSFLKKASADLEAIK
jgi:hypothetical protein